MWHIIFNSDSNNRATDNIVVCLLYWVFIKLLYLIILIKNKFISIIRQTGTDYNIVTQQHNLQTGRNTSQVSTFQKNNLLVAEQHKK